MERCQIFGNVSIGDHRKFRNLDLDCKTCVMTRRFEECQPLCFHISDPHSNNSITIVTSAIEHHLDAWWKVMQMVRISHLLSHPGYCRNNANLSPIEKSAPKNRHKSSLPPLSFIFLTHFQLQLPFINDCFQISSNCLHFSPLLHTTSTHPQWASSTLSTTAFTASSASFPSINSLASSYSPSYACPSHMSSKRRMAYS